MTAMLRWRTIPILLLLAIAAPAAAERYALVIGVKRLPRVPGGPPAPRRRRRRSVVR